VSQFFSIAITYCLCRPFQGYLLACNKKRIPTKNLVLGKLIILIFDLIRNSATRIVFLSDIADKRTGDGIN
jgi:hypothetical protein